MHTSREYSVAVLDAHHRHSLAVVRSLGKAGIKVYAVSSEQFYPARLSKYCYRHLHCDLYQENGSSVGDFVKFLDENHIDIIIPTALKGNEFICKYREELRSHSRAAYNDSTTFELLSDKNKTRELALTLGIYCPKTVVVTDLHTISCDGFHFPVVFKSVVDQGTVQYAHSPAELKRIVIQFWKTETDIITSRCFPIVQEYIQGDGYGFFGLTIDGELKSFFMHKRIHEVPPSGGPSAMAESIYDQELYSVGKLLLEESKWNGVAMAEFKKSSMDGKFYLMEVNPKFWGSLDLAIYAGIDFPRRLFEELMGELYDHRSNYQTGIRYRWISMDLAYSLQSGNFATFVGDFFRRDIKNDFVSEDVFPFIVLFLRSIYIFFEKRFFKTRHIL